VVTWTATLYDRPAVPPESHTVTLVVVWAVEFTAIPAVATTVAAEIVSPFSHAVHASVKSKTAVGSFVYWPGLESSDVPSTDWNAGASTECSRAGPGRRSPKRSHDPAQAPKGRTTRRRHPASTPHPPAIRKCRRRSHHARQSRPVS